MGGRGRCMHFAATTIAAFLLLSAAAEKQPTTRDADESTHGCIRKILAASDWAANGGVYMYDGYKESWVSCLMGKLVDGRGELTGVERKGCGGLGRLNLHWRRDTTRATTAAHPW